jgi:uncharacterized membrane protein YphA (DoxX/SURF4 family)
VGLLLLRAAVGLTAAAAGVLYSSNPSMPVSAKWPLSIALTAGGAALAVGVFTPIAGAVVSLCFLGVAVSWVPAPFSHLHDTAVLGFAVVITGLAVALLGPGAFSLDGYLFGRREIIIPPSSGEPES